MELCRTWIPPSTPRIRLQGRISGERSLVSYQCFCPSLEPDCKWLALQSHHSPTQLTLPVWSKSRLVGNHWLTHGFRTGTAAALNSVYLDFDDPVIRVDRDFELFIEVLSDHAIRPCWCVQLEINLKCESPSREGHAIHSQFATSVEVNASIRWTSDYCGILHSTVLRSVRAIDSIHCIVSFSWIIGNRLSDWVHLVISINPFTSWIGSWE